MILFFGEKTLEKTKQKNQKRQKPIDADIHLKYLCDQCGQTHWLSFLEASTSGYKVVCDCGNIFKVKKVNGFKLKYSSKKLPQPEVAQPIATIQTQTISFDLLDSASKVLMNYGFTKTEASELISNYYSTNPVNDISVLVKETLKSLRN